MGKAKVIFQEDLCKGCKLCKIICPRGIIKMADYINVMGYHPAQIIEPEKCSGCLSCALMCPEVVIRVEREVVV
ncbi:MAG: 4Fe-4S dicluster domain-containing protein [Peptococcia bacterium]|jgi:2-oxoglutarate ferredoxin oxidoreductase subunit delta